MQEHQENLKERIKVVSKQVGGLQEDVGKMGKVIKNMVEEAKDSEKEFKGFKRERKKKMGELESLETEVKKLTKGWKGDLVRYKESMVLREVEQIEANKVKVLKQLMILLNVNILEDKIKGLILASINIFRAN